MKRLLILFAFLFSLNVFSQPGSAFLNQLKTENTGITAIITFDGARFKVTDFEDNSGNIPKGATFKLLNTQMAKDDIGLYNVKIKIVDDNASGRYNGKIGYVYAASTNLSVDYTTGYVVTKKSNDGKTAKTGKKASNKFLNRVATEKTGITGRVTFSPTASLKSTGFDDNTRVNEGSTFELLSFTMVKDNIDLYTIKIKIIDDNGTGKYNGTVGYMYGASTDLADYMDYTSGTISKGSTAYSPVKKSYSGNFIDRLPTTSPNVFGRVTFSPTASLKSTGFDDNTRVNEGATFELLSNKMVKDDIGLYTIKIKIINDNGTGKYNGKIGYMYPASTTLTDYTDYLLEEVVGGPKTLKEVKIDHSNLTGEDFLDRLPSEKTGITGVVTFAPDASLKSTGFDDDTKVPEKAVFELLNKKMVKDDIGLYTIKVRITDDKSTGTYNGYIGYIYAASTSLADNMDYSSGRIDIKSNTTNWAVDDNTTSAKDINSSDFLDRLATTNTGVTGKVTFAPTASLKSTGFKDLTRVNEGATFNLLNVNMIKDDYGLYTIKIKIIDDNGSGKYNGAIGYIYGASTSLADDMDYVTEKIDINSSSKTVAVDDNAPIIKDTDGLNFLDRLPTENTSINGKVTFSPTASLKSTGFKDQTRVNEGSTFTLLNRKMIKDDIGLYTIKIKIIDDNGSGKYNGKEGYMYPASTSLSDYTDYINEVIDIDKGTLVPQNDSFLDLIPDEFTGLTGTVTFDNISLKKTSFADEEPRLKKGAVIELLSPKIIKDDKIQNVYYIKVLIVDDKGGGTYNKQVGYIYPGSTSFSTHANYTSLEIDITGLINSQTNKVQTKKFLGLIPTEKTGHEGEVTFDGGTLKTKSFADVEPKLPKGTRIELYGEKMVKDNTSLGLHHIKVRVIDGPHKGKIGLMYPSSTSFSNYTDYKTGRIRIEDIK